MLRSIALLLHCFYVVSSNRANDASNDFTAIEQSSEATIASNTDGGTSAAAANDAPTKTKRPNIVLILDDQMQAGAMGVAGNGMVQTPNLDRLASQGFRTTNAYSAQPVCSPYRAQFMTGRYGWNTGVTRNDVKLPNEERTIAEILKNEGYHTGYVGKWHLGGSRYNDGGYIKPEDRQGFDFWAALSCSHNYFNTKYYRDDPSDPVEIVNGFEPWNQTDEAVGFIDRKAGDDQPFFLVVSYVPPHNPYQPHEEYDIYRPEDVPLRPNVPPWQEHSARNAAARYYGLVTSVDDMVGRIMRTLDERNLYDDTIVLFTSDHGDMLYSHGVTKKQRPHEESANVPFIIRYPESNIVPGTVSDLLMSSVDILPTVLGLVGIEHPADIVLDGKDLSLSLATNNACVMQEQPDALLLYNDLFGSNSPGWAWRAIKEARWKYAISPAGGWLLFDLEQDPYEMTNLIEDPAYSDQYARLHARLVELRKQSGDFVTLVGRNQTAPPEYPSPPHFNRD